MVLVFFLLHPTNARRFSILDHPHLLLQVHKISLVFHWGWFWACLDGGEIHGVAVHVDDGGTVDPPCYREGGVRSWLECWDWDFVAQNLRSTRTEAMAGWDWSITVRPTGWWGGWKWWKWIRLDTATACRVWNGPNWKFQNLVAKYAMSYRSRKFHLTLPCQHPACSQACPAGHPWRALWQLLARKDPRPDMLEEEAGKKDGGASPHCLQEDRGRSLGANQ